MDLAARAVTLNPLERGYLNQHADAEGFAAREPGEREAALRNELNVQEKLLRRFQPGSSEVLGFALTRHQLGQIVGADGVPPTSFVCPATFEVQPAEELMLFECALALDEFNVLLRTFVLDFYEGEGFEVEASLHRVVIFCWTQPCEEPGPAE